MLKNWICHVQKIDLTGLRRLFSTVALPKIIDDLQKCKSGCQKLHCHCGFVLITAAFRVKVLGRGCEHPMHVTERTLQGKN